VSRFFLMLAALILSTVALANPHEQRKAQEAKPQAKPTATPKEGDKAPMMVSFAEMNWVELPERKGMQFAVLSGDPKTGAYTQMRKVPAGTDNPLHAHSSEIKNVIISGVWYTGVDAASARDFGPGSVVLMPANWVHVSGCRTGIDCVFYQEGKGKFDFKPVETKPSEMKP
jgi:quercetin dioxygenase-like cupin family protein